MEIRVGRIVQPDIRIKLCLDPESISSNGLLGSCSRFFDHHAKTHYITGSTNRGSFSECPFNKSPTILGLYWGP